MGEGGGGRRRRCYGVGFFRMTQQLSDVCGERERETGREREKEGSRLLRIFSIFIFIAAAFLVGANCHRCGANCVCECVCV